MTCPGGCASAYPPYRSLFKLCVDIYASGGGGCQNVSTGFNTFKLMDFGICLFLT